MMKSKRPTKKSKADNKKVDISKDSKKTLKNNLGVVVFVIALIIIIALLVLIMSSSSKQNGVSKAVKAADAKAQNYINDYNKARYAKDKATYAKEAGNTYMSVKDYSDAYHWLNISSNEYLKAHETSQLDAAEAASNSALMKEQTQKGTKLQSETNTVPAPKKP